MAKARNIAILEVLRATSGTPRVFCAGVCVWLLCLCHWGCNSHTAEPTPQSEATPSKVVQSSGIEPSVESVRAVRPDDWFVDQTEASGVAFTYRNGREGDRFLLIESYGGGAAIVDFDEDGDVDLFVTGGGDVSREEPLRIGGLPCGLFRNDGDFRFSAIADKAGLGGPIDYSQGCAVADYNSDGFPDLFVCCYGRSRLYCNLGDGTYLEVEEAQLPALGWSTAAAFGDVDGDGFPELMLARYTDWTPERDIACYDIYQKRDICGPTSYPGTTCQLWHNSGDGSFEDWSDDIGMKDGVYGLGIVVTDLNDDGFLDFYVSSDAFPNHLYLGDSDAKLHECGVESGVAFGEWGQPEGGMGIGVGDYDGDGAVDLFVTNFENEDNSLYRNLGEAQWVHRSVSTGLAGVSRRRVGFGTAMTDFDNDGWLDLFVLNGNPIYETAETPFKQQAQLFQNVRGERFVDVSQQAGAFFEEAHSGRGSAVGDLDDDGAPDLVVSLINEPIRILRNQKPADNFIRVELHARHGERDATGARVSCDFAGRKLVRWVTKGSGFFSESDPRILFPAEPETSEAEVTVQWPGRGEEVFPGLAPRQTNHLMEGRGSPVP